MHSCHSDQNLKYTRAQIIIVMFLQSKNKTIHSGNSHEIVIHIMQACKKQKMDWIPSHQFGKAQQGHGIVHGYLRR